LGTKGQLFVMKNLYKHENKLVQISSFLLGTTPYICMSVLPFWVGIFIIVKENYVYCLM